MIQQPSAFRPVPRTGVIFVTTEAVKKGYKPEDTSWCNLGQGQPETVPLEQGADRLTEITIPGDSYEYAPVPGLPELRDSVAQYYNSRFRSGMTSQYTADNVAICSGGRLALARAALALGNIHLGHFLPDYTAYEELLTAFRIFTPIPIMLDGTKQYAFSAQELENEIVGRGLGALLLSNPCNPTGKTLVGDELEAWVQTGRRLNCAMIFDEFYSHYVWKKGPGYDGGINTVAKYIQDVETEDTIIIDGLTKNWRYPGLRLSWTLGPKHVIDAIASAGSFLDGGACRPVQEAAIRLLNEESVDKERTAIQKVFGAKRDYLLQRLQKMGIQVDLPSEGSFYVWGRVNELPQGLNTDMLFFEKALGEKIITVPGRFFDIDPGQRRYGRRSRFDKYLRFSFGPAMPVLKLACDRLETMIQSA